MELQTENLDTATAFKQILLCVDPTVSSARAAAFVPNLANKETHVRIVGVIENARAASPLGPLAAFHLSAAHAQWLAAFECACAVAKEMFTSSGAVVEIQILDLVTHGGKIVHELAKCAQDWKADLLVIGSRQHHGLLHGIEGPLSEPLMKFAERAIFVVPERCDFVWRGSPQRILFADDGSSASQEALRIGARLVNARTDLRAVHVLDLVVRLPDFVPQTLLQDALVEEGDIALASASELFERLTDAGSPRLDTALLYTAEANDDVAHAIVREAGRWHADLLVMGTHGRRGGALLAQKRRQQGRGACPDTAVTGSGERHSVGGCERSAVPKSGSTGTQDGNIDDPLAIARKPLFRNEAIDGRTIGVDWAGDPVIATLNNRLSYSSLLPEGGDLNDKYCQC
ncbi:Nucleotide-binding universal stress protein, UspA family [Burkholderia sp. D7]|nr:Nucleotide-binding universal stress protein, UspA family [Burkholderia sp. D7]